MVRREVQTLAKELAITSAGTGEGGQGKEKARTGKEVGWVGVGGWGCKTDMQSTLWGEVAEKKEKKIGGGPMQGGEEEFGGGVSPSQSNKVSLFGIKRHETEQSEKSQFGGRWFNKQHWSNDRGYEWR